MKNLKNYPWRLGTAVRFLKELPVKNSLYLWQKTKTAQICVFTGYFNFHKEKTMMIIAQGDCNNTTFSNVIFVVLKVHQEI